MKIYKNITEDTAEELGFQQNFIDSMWGGIDVCECRGIGNIHQWEVTEYNHKTDTVTIKLMNMEEMDEFMDILVNKK